MLVCVCMCVRMCVCLSSCCSSLFETEAFPVLHIWFPLVTAMIRETCVSPFSAFYNHAYSLSLCDPDINCTMRSLQPTSMSRKTILLFMSCYNIEPMGFVRLSQNLSSWGWPPTPQCMKGCVHVVIC